MILSRRRSGNHHPLSLWGAIIDYHIIRLADNSFNIYQDIFANQIVAAIKFLYQPQAGTSGLFNRNNTPGPVGIINRIRAIAAKDLIIPG